MQVTQTTLPGVVLIRPQVHGDSRGFFLEVFHADRYRRLAGIDLPFVQDNRSRSRYGVLRGLHGQRRHPQGKLVRVCRGRIFDVAVDVDPQSATFGRWFGHELSDENQAQMYIPPGYLHGFVVLSELADVEYKCTNYYQPDDEVGLIWDDPRVAVEWPIAQPRVSDKDRTWPRLESFDSGGANS